MKKRILSACIIALGTASCTESSPPPSPAVSAAPVVVAPTPVVEIELEPEEVSAAKAASPVEDTIGLPHEHRIGTDHLGRARALRAQGNLPEALSEARRAVFDDANDEESLIFTAQVARLVKDPRVAAEAYGRLGQLRGEDAVPVIQRARVLLSMGDREGAIAAGQAGVERDGNNPEGYQVLGRAYLSQGQLGPAIAMFEKAVELDPAHGYALNNLGLAYLRSNQNEKALEVLSKAAQQLPHVAYVHNNLGVAMERAGRLEEARVAFNRSMSLSPKYVKAAINAQRVAQAPPPLDSRPEESLMPELELPEE